MTRFTLMIDGIHYALPFVDFSTLDGCIASIQNLHLLLSDVASSYQMQCIDRATGSLQYAVEFSRNFRED